MVKLKSRWQDTVSIFQERMKLLRLSQKERRKIATLRVNAATLYALKRSDRYSMFVKSMRGKMGILSITAISKGTRNMNYYYHYYMSHYNARKRVYTRRQISRQLAQKLRIERWTKRYTALRREKRERWMWMRGPGVHYMEDLPFAWKDVTLTEPSHASWFDAEGYPLTSRDPETGRFVNPWLSESSNGENGVKNFLKWKVGGALSRFVDAFDSSTSKNRGISQYGIAEVSEQNTQSANPNTHQNQTLTTVEEDEITHHDETIRLTWIGHSTTLVTFPGNFTLLTDPHFHNYAGPVRRMAPPALGIADLPEIVDCVLISHDHMDHLNYWSILELIDSNIVRFWIVPLGVKSWLMDKAGIYPENIVELEWWQSVRLSKQVGGKYSNVVELSRAYDRATGKHMDRNKTRAADSDKDELLITCAPAQHWCSRTPFDRNTRLWCSFSVHATPAHSELRREQGVPHIHSFYFAGDTGLPTNFPLHHQIGDRLGPFDLSAIPIGAYKPEWFMRESHCTPTEAVKIHQAIRSKRSVAIHYDTFELADEPREEPPKLLLAEVGRVNYDILRVAADVVEVADGIGITAAQMLLKKEGASPPFVDFAIIKQGESIESLPM